MTGVTLVPPPLFVSGVRVTQSSVFCVVFCGQLFGVLYFFFWPLYCLSFDLQKLIIPLVSSNSSIHIYCATYMFMSDCVLDCIFSINT